MRCDVALRFGGEEGGDADLGISRRSWKRFEKVVVSGVVFRASAYFAASDIALADQMLAGGGVLCAGSEAVVLKSDAARKCRQSSCEAGCEHKVSQTSNHGEIVYAINRGRERSSNFAIASALNV